jgi:branched-chain amino acid transport system ATP-binding protein
MSMFAASMQVFAPATVDRHDCTLAIESVSKHFGGVYALRNVTFRCGIGEIVGLIGPNGAGKTTLMNVISGISVPDSGSVSLFGTPLTGATPTQCAIAGIGRTFQNIRLFNQLTVRQNIEVAHTTCEGHRTERVELISIDTLLDEFDLRIYADRMASELAYGYQRRLEIARALALGPEILLLDEPAAGMNHRESDVLIDTIRDVCDRYGCGIVVIDHDMRFIMRVCKRIVVLHLGEVIAEGTPQEIQRNPAVIEVYIGGRGEEGAAHA